MEYFKYPIYVIMGHGQWWLDSNNPRIEHRPCDQDSAVVEALRDLKTDIVIWKFHADHQPLSTNFRKDIRELTGQLLQPL